MNIRDFLSAGHKEAVHAAVQQAESQTSGEIRVHLENHCKGEVRDRATFIFRKLGMSATAERNAVLFYVAVKDRKFAILGDAGINAKVQPDFWDDIKKHMVMHFKEERYGESLALGVRMAGEQLKAHFPLHPDDKNELNDDISYSDTKQ